MYTEVLILVRVQAPSACTARRGNYVMFLAVVVFFKGGVGGELGPSSKLYTTKEA
jgi:hypothetical protein